MDLDNLQKIYDDADCIYSLQDVETALDKLVAPLTQHFAHKNPLVLGVMNGSLATLGYLLPRLNFLLEIDYVHATRYQGALQGNTLVWKRKPEIALAGRHILLVDDLLDQGITLKAIVDHCLGEHALSVSIAVLGTKRIAGYSAPIAADYSALDIPDKYVFGFGMDYHNYWRNAPGIFACKE
ncbi:MAG TPA: hypoxanthine-guanine phosphoribosyltransferase [Cellvibrio sp.]